MLTLRIAALLISVGLLSGCAVSSAIEKADTGRSEFEGAVYGGKINQINAPIPDAEKHRIFHQGSTGFISVETIRNSALERVNAFCAQSGNQSHLIQETTSTPPHILGNWPRIEIVFSCIKTARTESAPTPQDKYDRLSKLKALLDSGAITRKEYETEKQKVLSE